MKGEVRARVPLRPELIGDASRPALHGGARSMPADTGGGPEDLLVAEATAVYNGVRKTD